MGRSLTFKDEEDDDNGKDEDEEEDEGLDVPLVVVPPVFVVFFGVYCEYAEELTSRAKMFLVSSISSL